MTSLSFRFWRRCLVVAAAAAIVAGCSSHPSATSLPESGPLTLQAGDRIQVSVFGQDSLATETALSNDGEVTLPLAGRIRLADMTPSQAEAAIASRLRGGLVVDPKVTVDVVKYRPVYVLGEVSKPGAYDYVNKMTVIQAIALAGGYTYRAKIGEATVLRPRINGQTPVPVTETMTLEPGDVVNIPERWY
jgi:protein involved in polysaccharide export with SLBB domain